MKLEGLKNAYQSLSATTMDSGFFGGLFESGTKVLNIVEMLIDKIGVLGTLAGGYGIVKGFQGGGETIWKSPDVSNNDLCHRRV